MGVALVSAAACSDGDGGGFDILAEGERNPDVDDAVVTGDVTDPTATPGEQPRPTAPTAPGDEPRPTPTALPTPTPAPTSTPIPTPTATATPQPTPTPLPELPVVQAPPVVRARVGQTVDTGISVSSPAGNPVLGIDLDGAPPGMTGIGSFRPTEPGTWNATLEVRDSFGRRVDREVVFVARYEANDDAIVAMGDSVASGHGLDLRDYLGRDSCFRSNDGYPRRVRNGLQVAGLLSADAELALVACSGADADDLFSDEVTGGLDGTGPADGNRRTQLEWAVRANPAYVLVTAGINNIGFVDPARLIRGGQLSSELLEPRLARIEADLGLVVDELVAKTDATVVVTGYYNPTAARPQGIAGCETSCFYAVTEEAVRRLNTSIRRALPSDDRVLFVDLAPVFVGHGAPNGYGPDGAREGAGFLGGLLGDYTAGVQAYCAKGDSRGEPWVNAVDCVHPTEAGAAAIADTIVGAITG